MVIVIKPNSTILEVNSALQQLKITKRTSKKWLQKFCGSIQKKEDALSLQKRLRDEWK